ncbi:MAG TPA: hypothetical protein VFF31_28375 [Blastocatellia bacterium]|jgi:hypothetical protein|nr:hypothetical protein [Blastocatellia bacterium]
MTLRERTEDDRVRGDQSSPDDGSSDANLRQVRLAGQSLLAAGADAIQRALSGDSERFLQATRQEGGQ